MPYTTPDYSQYIGIKRISTVITSDKQLSSDKLVATIPHSYQLPLYKTIKLPTNSLLSNKFLRNITPPIISGTNNDVFLLDSSYNGYLTNDFVSFTSLGTISKFNSINIPYIMYNNSVWYAAKHDPTSFIIKSTDNAVTWTNSGTVSDYLRYIQIVETDIYALNANSLYKSTNSGSNWSQIKNFSPDIFCTNFFVNGTNFLVLGNRILWTSSNSTTFTNQISKSGCTQPVFSNALYYNNTYYTFGYDYDSNKLFRLTTTDLTNFTRTNLSGNNRIMCIRRNPITGIIVACIGMRTTGESALKWSMDDGLTWNNCTGSVGNKDFSTLSLNVLNTNFVNKLWFNGVVFIVSLIADSSTHYSLDGKAWQTLSKLPNGNNFSYAGIKITDQTGQYN